MSKRNAIGLFPVYYLDATLALCAAFLKKRISLGCYSISHGTWVSGPGLKPIIGPKNTFTLTLSLGLCVSCTAGGQSLQLDRRSQDRVETGNAGKGGRRC